MSIIKNSPEYFKKFGIEDRNCKVDYPYYEEDLTQEERIEHQVEPDILTDVEIININDPSLNK